MPLTAINATHGSFDVVMENITHGVYYCLRYFLSFSVCICTNLKCICTNINCICIFMIIIRVELVNHPYCNSGADQSLDRQTKICRPALWNEPIFIGQMSMIMISFMMIMMIIISIVMIIMIMISIMIIIMMPFMIFIKKIPSADHQCGPLPPCPESRPNLPLITGDNHDCHIHYDHDN